MTSSLLPIVLCGGAGTRLWPLSREAYPKQFLALSGTGATMLQDTLKRLEGLAEYIPRASPVVVCNSEHRFLVAQQLLEAKLNDARLILEPVGRSTAPALTLAALVADANDILLVMPADHSISKVEGLHRALETAWRLANEGSMVAFGIQADRPETGYGYIQKAEVVYGHEAFSIKSFEEKPSVDVAQAFLESGNYYWNSGMFMVRASQWLTAVAALQPRILMACKNSIDQSSRDLDFIRPHEEIFKDCPADSIDYAVMEHLAEHRHLDIPAHVVPMNAGWSDIGAWDSLWETLPHDAQGNVCTGQTLAIDTRNSLLFSETCLIAALGVDNLVVIETADAILVADKLRAQEVKKIVSELKEKKQLLVSSHRKVHRPWGWYDRIDGGERFQVKRIVVNPGASLSLQMHNHRAEHWIVVKGTAEVTHGERCFRLRENESTYIPVKHLHRLRNPGLEPLEIVEVQSGDYLGEDDIVRFDDIYGRTEEVNE